ncbi:MAG: DUF4097 family beta strand repeat-containing protein [bacterium]
MRSTMQTLTAACLILGAAPVLARAQAAVGRAESVYTWRGTIPMNGTFTVKNFNGPIDVRPSSGNTVELRAEKITFRGGDIHDVGFVVRTSSGGDVTICSTTDDESCDGDRRRDDRHRGENVKVAMTVLVPRTVRLNVATGNGAVSVENAGSEVEAATGNGRVRVVGTEGRVRVSTGNGAVEVRGAKAPVKVSTGNGDVDVTTAEGPVEVSSGNGDIDVRMSAVRARDDMEFHTGRGSVRLTLPASYSGELDASTGNGSINSEFDLKVKGRLDPHRVRATIGDGGPMLRMSTGNGRFDIRKG